MRIPARARRGLPGALLLPLLVAGCGEHVADGSVVPPPPSAPRDPSVVMSPDGIGVAIGGMLQMNVVAKNFTTSGWVWAVSDSSLASVSSIGMVTAKRVGTVGIRACALDLSSVCGGATLNLVQPQ